MSFREFKVLNLSKNEVKDLVKELLHGLKCLAKTDRDLKSLVIWCNPNRIRGSDEGVKLELLKILNSLESQDMISKEKKKLGFNTNSEGFTLYSHNSLLEV